MAILRETFYKILPEVNHLSKERKGNQPRLPQFSGPCENGLNAARLVFALLLDRCLRSPLVSEPLAASLAAEGKNRSGMNSSGDGEKYRGSR